MDATTQMEGAAATPQETEPIVEVTESQKQKFKNLCSQLVGHTKPPVSVLAEGVDVCLNLLKRRSDLVQDHLLLHNVFVFICALVARDQFGELFVRRHGIEMLLALPREPHTFSDLSSCLFKIASAKRTMVRVCALPSNVIHQMVSLVLLLLKQTQDQTRENAVSTFAAAFIFRPVLHAFYKQDGLQKLLNLIDEAVSGVQITEANEKIACLTTIALQRYFRAQVILFVDYVRSSGNNVPHSSVAYRPLDITDVAIDAVFRQIQKPGELGHAFVTVRWPAVVDFLKYKGHIKMLELCTDPNLDRDMLGTVEYALGVLQIVTLYSYGRIRVASATLTNHRLGIAVILDAANVAVLRVHKTYEAALSVLVNLVCWAPFGSIPSTSSKLRQSFCNVIDEVLKNTGIKVLLQLLSSMSSKALEHRVCALACRVLLGLAKDVKVAHMLTVFDLVEKTLSEFIRKSERRMPMNEEGRWHMELCQLANELMEIVKKTERNLYPVVRASIASTASITRLPLPFFTNQTSGRDQLHPFPSSGRHNFSLKDRPAAITSPTPIYKEQLHPFPSSRKMNIFLKNQPAVSVTSEQQTLKHKLNDSDSGDVGPSVSKRLKANTSLEDGLISDSSAPSAGTLFNVLDRSQNTLNHGLPLGPQSSTFDSKDACASVSKLKLDPLPNITSEIFNNIHGRIHGSRNVREYVYSSFKERRPYSNEPGLTCLAFLGGPSKIATGRQNGVLNAYGSDSHGLHYSLTMVKSFISGDTKLLLTSSQHTVRLWDAHEVSTGPKYSFDGIKAAAFSHCGDTFAAISSDLSTPEILLYDVATCKPDLKFRGQPSSEEYAYSQVHFSPSDNMLLWNGGLWDRRAGPRPVHHFVQLTDYGGGAFHPSGNEVIINSEVWDHRSFKQLLHYVPSLDQTSVNFNARGDVIYATLRRNLEELDSAFKDRYRKHPLYAAFRTLDAVNYSDIATIYVNRRVLDIATDPTDICVGLVTMVDDFRMSSSATVYEVGKRKPMEDDSDPDVSESEEHDWTIDIEAMLENNNMNIDSSDLDDDADDEDEDEDDDESSSTNVDDIEF